jgi:hypothetical protein
VGNIVNLSIHRADFKICMGDCMGEVNRQIYNVPHMHDARKWLHSSS